MKRLYYKSGDVLGNVKNKQCVFSDTVQKGSNLTDATSWKNLSLYRQFKMQISDALLNKTVQRGGQNRTFCFDEPGKKTP